MPTFTSIEQINKYIMDCLIDVVRIVGKKAANHLKNNIQKYIYDYGDGKRDFYYNGDADPTYEFLNTPTSDVKKSSNSVEVSIYSDTNRMSFNADTYKHGSNNWIVNDIRQWLPEILNDNLSGDIFGANQWWHHRQRYFDITCKELIDSGLALQWIKEELKKKGLNVV